MTLITSLHETFILGIKSNMIKGTQLKGTKETNRALEKLELPKSTMVLANQMRTREVIKVLLTITVLSSDVDGPHEKYFPKYTLVRRRHFVSLVFLFSFAELGHSY